MVGHFTIPSPFFLNISLAIPNLGAYSFPQNPVFNAFAALFYPSYHWFSFTRWLVSTTPRGVNLSVTALSLSSRSECLSLSALWPRRQLTRHKLTWTTVIVSKQVLIVAKASLMQHWAALSSECSSQFSPQVRDGCRCTERERKWKEGSEARWWRE